MEGVALDWPRPNDRDLHDEVVKVGRLRLWQGLHLGPRLHLEDADRVRGLDHLEDFGHVFRQPIEVDSGGTVLLDELERLVDGGQHPQAEQVELDELERLDVALVELDDDSVGHGGALDRREVDQRRRGHEHAAGVDAEVAGEAVDAGAERQPALPVGKSGGGAGTPRGGDLRWRLAPRHARMWLGPHQADHAGPAPDGWVRRAAYRAAGSVAGSV